MLRSTTSNYELIISLLKLAFLVIRFEFQDNSHLNPSPVATPAISSYNEEAQAHIGPMASHGHQMAPQVSGFGREAPPNPLQHSNGHGGKS